MILVYNPLVNRNTTEKEKSHQRIMHMRAHDIQKHKRAQANNPRQIRVADLSRKHNRVLLGKEQKQRTAENKTRTNEYTKTTTDNNRTHKTTTDLAIEVITLITLTTLTESSNNIGQEHESTIVCACTQSTGQHNDLKYVLPF